MYCTISTRTTETDQRRFAKKAQTKFPTHALVGNSLLRRFAKLSASGIGIANALDYFPFFFFFFFFVLGIYLFERGAGERWISLSLSSFVVCVLLLYTPPKPTQGSCMYEGQPG